MIVLIAMHKRVQRMAKLLRKTGGCNGKTAKREKSKTVKAKQAKQSSISAQTVNSFKCTDWHKQPHTQLPAKDKSHAQLFFFWRHWSRFTLFGIGLFILSGLVWPKWKLRLKSINIVKILLFLELIWKSLYKISRVELNAKDFSVNLIVLFVKVDIENSRLCS